MLMGTRAGVTVYGLDEARGQALADEVFAEWTRLDRAYSWYDPASELSRVNATAPLGPVTVSAEFGGLIARALEVHRVTAGGFDATFSPLWELWGRCAKAGRLPEPEELRAARSRAGSESVRLSPSRLSVRFFRPVSLNLGGLVKDYALRRGGELLSRRAPGVPVLLDLGGDLLAHGRKDPAWQVGVRHPLRPGGLLGTLSFPEGGVVLTSGDYERFVEIGGRRYGHILDARTGLPVSGFAGLTVYLPDASVEHLPSAALVLLGREAALSRVRAIPGALAVWVGSDGSVRTAEGPACRAAWLAEAS